MTLSARDKTPAAHGFGHDFHHTDPQRHVPCALGDILAPRSADDIPPISEEAMASVQVALRLLASMVADRDLGLFLGCGDAELEANRAKARDILLTARGLAALLRVAPPEPTSVSEAQLNIRLTSTEVAALRKARDHVRQHMATEHPWEDRDAAMMAIGKVLDAAREALPHLPPPPSTPGGDAGWVALVAALSAMPPYEGWEFEYMYPGFFRYYHPAVPYNVFFTPDWETDEALPIEVQTLDGDYVEEHSSCLPLPREGRTGAKLAAMVRPTLDKLLALSRGR